MSAAELKIRPAIKEDAARLLEIYAPYVAHTAVSFEYEVPSVTEFQGRIEKTLTRYPYLIGKADGKIVGYAYASAFKTREAYNWAAETSIYIDENEHGKGYGKKLYLVLEEMLKKQNVLNLNACIAYPNPDSIAFHERLGYKTVAHFSKCGYKFHTWYDMIWMEKLLGAHQENQSPFIPFNDLPDMKKLSNSK